jgi:hypothetical protein
MASHNSEGGGKLRKQGLNMDYVQKIKIVVERLWMIEIFLLRNCQLRIHVLCVKKME